MIRAAQRGPAAALAARRQVRAVQLRSLGYSYDAIAQALLPCDLHARNADGTAGTGRADCDLCAPMYANRSAAYKAVQRGLALEYAAGQETREQQRRHQLAQIDLLLQRSMRSAYAGDWEAMRAATRLLDRRARLLGLDAPARIAVTTELDAQIEALAAELLDEAGRDQEVEA